MNTELGTELPLGDARLQDHSLTPALDSQDVALILAELADYELDNAGLPMVDEVSGALVRHDAGELREVWITYSARPFDLRARYVLIRWAP